MAMSDYSLSDIAAVTDGVGNGNRGNGGWGGDGWWILLLFILLGWGNGNRGFGGNGNAGGDVLYPWLNQAQLTTQGFADQNAVMALNGIQSNIGSLSTQLCNCCSDIQMARTNGFAGVEQGANARQMANMQQMFGLSQQFADCCCENRLGLANLGADIAREACADRAAVSDGIRDVLTNQNANTQRILDQMCQDKIDAKNDEIQTLRTQLQVQNLAQSQTAQTAQILADNARQTQALEQYLNPTPIPSYQVANPNCCQQTFGCGCGM